MPAASGTLLDFVQVLRERGYIHQVSDEDGLRALATKGPVTAYIGFDCTAPSLHVGNLIGIMMLRVLQRCGHRPIALIGGGTTKVGDPSGKDESRKLLTEAEIDANKARIRDTFAKFLRFGEGKTDAFLVDNNEWLKDLYYIDFLREYGRHFTINRMLTFDSVKLRLEREQPLTFLEFNYMLLQAYDFLELARRYNCVLQMGGSDQWGNIVNGIELARRAEGRELFALTTPLLTTSSGAKMGKTVKGAVWLNADMLSPYDYWQFWRNTEDADVGRFLRLFTELPIDEIARLERLEDSEINEAKKILATEATTLAHSREAALAAAETSRAVFEVGGFASELPILAVPRDTLERGIAVCDLITSAKLAASKGEARRLVRGGGARINDRPVRSETEPVCLVDLDQQGYIRLSAGRKRHVLVRPV